MFYVLLMKESFELSSALLLGRIVTESLKWEWSEESELVVLWA